jgi:very-short-patch-repair endonuclease
VRVFNFAQRRDRWHESQFDLLPLAPWVNERHALGGGHRVASAANVIDQAERGRVTAIYCSNVTLARSQIRVAAEEIEPLPTLVALEWDQAPSLARELDEIRDALADAAQSLWPGWYVTAEERFEAAPSDASSIETLVAKDAARYPGASPSWLREAYRRCELGKRPVVRNIASAEQVRQLSLALDPKRLVFALSVAVADVSPARLRGLVRATEWLAHEARAKTLLLVPEVWRGRVELDHVSYRAVSLDPDVAYVPERASVRPRLDPDSSPTPDDEADATVGDGTATSGTSEAPHVTVGPIVGKPHPSSEVEQLVYARLALDEELAGLFEFNQRLPAFGDKYYIVDLVWRKGGLVIELDGPEHNGQIAYARDRERDYRLLVSGYSTLRVPNAEVCVDVDSVITKIRNVVHRLVPVNEEIR